MNVKPIANSLNGEHLISVFPPMKPDANLGWNRRLNLFTGRTLTDKALITEQQGRSGQLALRGQMVSPGVVQGLEVLLEPEVLPEQTTYYYHLMAGMGIAASGEDAIALRNLRVKVQDVRVYAPVRILQGQPIAPEPSEEGSPKPQRDRLPRQLGGRLQSLINSGIAANLPKAGVLVLQPIVGEIVGRNNPTDPCEIDPQNDAFADWQKVDGCRLIWYSWATEWIPLPEPGELSDAATVDRWRNRLAYTIFNAEKDLAPDQVLPWAEIGVPIALVGFDANWIPKFVDRYSVVRSGGKPKRRTALVSGTGNPFLWQARIQQFAEHLAEIDLSRTAIDDVAARFLNLPPLGVLPKNAIAVRGTTSTTGTNHFFPASYRLQAAPIPLEQLDVVMQASASLVPYTLSNSDQVQILVPVPQAWFDPNLLKREEVDPLFSQTIDEYVDRRAKWLNRREIVRSRRSLIAQAITGSPATYPTPDPDSLEEELNQPPVPFSSTRAHQSNLAAGSHQHYFEGANPPFVIAAGDRLFTYIYLDSKNLPTQVMLQFKLGNSWEHRAYWGASKLPWGMEGTNSRRYMGTLPDADRWVRLEIPANLVGLENSEINGIAFTLFDGRAAWAHTGKSAAGASSTETIWIGNNLPTSVTPKNNSDAWNWIEGRDLNTPFEADYQTVTSNGTRQLTPLQTLKTQLGTQVPTEASQLDANGLEKFIILLENKVQQANDRLDFHFLRVQTDIYRIRQRVLGIEEATRLATSPVLAALAKNGESARVTQEQLGKYLSDIKFQEYITRSKTTPTETRSVAPPVAPERSGSATSDASEARSGILDAKPTLFRSPFTSFTENVAPQVVTFKKEAFVTGTDFPARSSTSSAALEAFTAKQLTQQTTSTVAGSLFVSDFARSKAITTDDVLEQSPLVGAALRTVTIAQRLQESLSVEARASTLASRADVISNLVNANDFGVDLGDISVPGTKDETGKTKTFREITPAFLDTIRKGKTIAQTDEAAQFDNSVQNLDDTVATLRLAEGRVQNYRTAIALCRQTLEQLRSLLNNTDQRLSAIASKLAEARHDVSVAKALLAEEQQRVDGINQRRDQIVRDHVPFLMFHRPRFTDVLLDTPTRPLDPGITESPVPQCLREDLPTPPELQSFIDVLREAPAFWFTHIPKLLDRFDRFDALFRVIQSVQVRGINPLLLQDPIASNTSRYSQSLTKVFVNQRQSVFNYRQQIAQLNLNTFDGQSWKQVRDRSEQIVSIADLINGYHGRSDVAQLAAKHLAEIADIATCLYGEFGDVLPVLRLDWAERISQFDAPINLRNLAVLPRWGEVPFLQRRKIQTLVDWLYQQINPLQTNAVALMNDLVRVCILLASHAPINQIIAGRLARPTVVKPGSRIEVAIDPNLIRLGMNVFVYSNTNQVIAKGIVEDLGSGLASARIVQTSIANQTLTENARVQFMR
jgi:hypothetical protein